MKNNLRSAVFLALCFVLASSIAGATTVNCITVTNVVVQLGAGTNNNCDVLPNSTVLFSNFFVSPTTGTVSIDASPFATGVFGGEIDMGFQLSGLTTDVNGNFDLQLTYEVKGGVSGIDLGFTASLGQGHPNGSVRLTELACVANPNGLSVTAAGCTGVQLANITATSTGALAANSMHFASNNDVVIVKDIQFNSFATLSEVENSVFTGVPEPGTMLLSGAALCGLALIGRRRTKA
jgi:PEP-CTERM motif